MSKHPKFESYVEACNYPGVLDEHRVESSIAQYLKALGEKRKIVRLPAGWKLAQYPSLEKYVDAVLKEFDKNRAAIDAIDARDARDARAARDAIDARDARDARAAIDAIDARDARDARAARAAIDARAARAARDAIDARDARAARDDEAKQRFASWCIQSPGWGWYRFELSWIVTTFFGAQTDEVRAWSEPLLDAFIGGCWMLHWTEDTLYWVAKPSTHTIETPNGKRLHNESGPALESDIEPLYFLNGILMEAEHVLTPAERLEPTAILAEPNVDVRRELIRKIGVELMLSKLPHRVMHKQGDYEVLSVDFPDLIQDARYLKMLNPSIGVWHLEGIERECDTVQKALNWRAGRLAKNKDWQPSQLT